MSNDGFLKLVPPSTPSGKQPPSGSKHRSSGSLDVDATVYVKLGGDSDTALYLRSRVGLAQAKALAEKAFANL